ncbi:MAG TPA: hypothetical protein VIX91_21245 [Candidatus Acidoferrum sp.]
MAALTLAALSVPPRILWPYIAGLALLAIGLFVILKKEIPQVHGLDRLMPFGRLFFAVPLAVFAAQHFTIAKNMAPMVPSWIPAQVFWIYFVGVALVAAALSMLFKKYSQLAATLLGIMILLFVVLLHIPRVVANPTDRISWTVALRDLAFSGGAFAFAGAQSRLQSKSVTPALLTLTRFLIAIAALFFGVEHFLHPEFAPGIPLEKLTPTWIPFRLFWAYLAGAVLIVAGVCILVNKEARLAATWLGIMILLIVLVIYLPILIDIPLDIGNGLNYFADTMLFSGAALLLADALPKEKTAPSN